MDALDKSELHILATYNAEKARGIRHAYLWRIRMEKLQAHFDVYYKDKVAVWTTEEKDNG
jgi:hypothetical protein